MGWRNNAMDTSITRAIPNDAPGWHNTQRDNEQRIKKKKKKKKGKKEKAGEPFFLILLLMDLLMNFCTSQKNTWFSVNISLYNLGHLQCQKNKNNNKIMK